MARDYKKLAHDIINIIGEDNILTVTHCATRLRFKLSKIEPSYKDSISKLVGVITVVESGGQFQVVIGNHVTDVYSEISKILDLENNPRKDDEVKEKINPLNKIVDVISAIFAPFLYTLAACGILQGILGVLVAMGALDTSTGTYRILNFLSWTGFTFLPVLIAITASKKFNVNIFVSVITSCALVNPDFLNIIKANTIMNTVSSDPAIKLLTEQSLSNPDFVKFITDVVGIPINAPTLSFLGIPIQMLSYTSSVIPIILSIWILSYIERFFNKILPTVIRNLFTPMLSLVVIVPLTLLVFGPIGNAIGGAIGGIYNYLYALSPIVAGIIVGGLWEILVIFGVHWGITPVTVGNYATLGYDSFTGLQASAVFSQAGAALGTFFKTRNKEMRSVSLSATITAIFGITEPAIYGVNLRLKKPMICGCIAGAVGGGIAGAFGAVSWGYNMPGIATLPAYFKEGYTTQFIGLIISVIVSFVLGTVLTYIVGFKDEENNMDNTENVSTEEVSTEENNNNLNLKCNIATPIIGEVIPLESIEDEVFSSGAIGKGVAIIPSEGKVYAPFDGKVDSIFETKHAIALKSNDGVELLIHVGMDTVKLKGKGFTSHINNGDEISKGQLLLEFDIDIIKENGLSIATPVVVANTNDYLDIVIGKIGAISKGDDIINCIK